MPLTRNARCQYRDRHCGKYDDDRTPPAVALEPRKTTLVVVVTISRRGICEVSKHDRQSQQSHQRNECAAASFDHFQLSRLQRSSRPSSITFPCRKTGIPHMLMDQTAKRDANICGGNATLLKMIAGMGIASNSKPREPTSSLRDDDPRKRSRAQPASPLARSLHEELCACRAGK